MSKGPGVGPASRPAWLRVVIKEQAGQCESGEGGSGQITQALASHGEELGFSLSTAGSHWRTYVGRHEA